VIRVIFSCLYLAMALGGTAAVGWIAWLLWLKSTTSTKLMIYREVIAVAIAMSICVVMEAVTLLWDMLRDTQFLHSVRWIALTVALPVFFWRSVVLYQMLYRYYFDNKMRDRLGTSA
jgi:hypothetical protein